MACSGASRFATTTCRRMPSWCASMPGAPLAGDGLRAAAAARLQRHLGLRPADNPFHRFARQLVVDLPRLLDGDAADYHAYTFATVRMAGAGFELLAEHVDWLLGTEAATASTALREIVGRLQAAGLQAGSPARIRPATTPRRARGRVGKSHVSARRIRGVSRCRSSAPPSRLQVQGDQIVLLDREWQVAAAAPAEPAAAATFEHLSWLPARVPGTVGRSPA